MAFIDILRKHIDTYSEYTVQDLYKMVYQSEFGGGHIIIDLDAHLDYLIKELEETKNLPCKDVEILDQDVYRLYLDGLYGKVNPKTIEEMIIVSSNERTGSEEMLLHKIELLSEVCKNDKPAAFLTKVIESNYPIYSHSLKYKTAYNPHYRIINKDYAFYFKVFMAIDELLKTKKNPVIAIDGMTTSGKSYLAKCIQSIYHGDIIHVDDFFLQEDQKTEERLNEVGGNLDYERLESEVLMHLDDDNLSFAPYDCQTKQMGELKKINRDKPLIIEGSYSLRPSFRKYYDLSIYLEVDDDVQDDRVLHRNEASYHQFVELWIPKENTYQQTFQIKSTADLVFDTTTLFDI